jgi:Cu-Zn family superoxide dismutase
MLGAACAHSGGVARRAMSESRPAATASLIDSAGKTVGTATFRNAGDGVAIDLQVTGLRAGTHGIHIHTVGRCDPPAFTTAGGHFNPGAMKHGLQAAGGPHAGDLPNFVVPATGPAHYTGNTSRVTLGPGATSLFDADGSAIVIHAGPDDNMTDPAGNSGARIVCGVITKS